MYIRGAGLKCANPANSNTFVLTNCITNCKLGMKITKHAFIRMAERGFNPEMLASMMKGRIFVRPSDNGSFIVVGKVDKVFWTVLMASDMYTVITVRRAHPNEETSWNTK